MLPAVLAVTEWSDHPTCCILLTVALTSGVVLCVSSQKKSGKLCRFYFGNIKIHSYGTVERKLSCLGNYS